MSRPSVRPSVGGRASEDEAGKNSPINNQSLPPPPPKEGKSARKNESAALIVPPPIGDHVMVTRYFSPRPPSIERPTATVDRLFFGRVTMTKIGKATCECDSVSGVTDAASVEAEGPNPRSVVNEGSPSLAREPGRRR